MWSGRYPHNNKIEGFYEVKNPGYPHLVDLMKGAVFHGNSWESPAFDALHALRLGRGARHAAQWPAGPSKRCGFLRCFDRAKIKAAKDAGKPFCLIMNIMDPHKPFYAEGRDGETVPDAHQPTRVFTPDEVPIPGFLFDDPVCGARNWPTITHPCGGATIRSE